MGIRGLHSYILDQIPQSTKTINILDEIDNFKSQRGKNPVIIINLWTMFNHFELSDSIEVECVGKRINMVKVKFELFLGKLVNHGATLMFVFKKTRLRELDFIINEENDYKRTQKFLHEMKNSNYTSDVVNYVEGLYNRKLSRNEIVSIGLVQSAQKFGKLCGVMDSSIKQSTHDDDLATKEDALAILGTDSYYFFYKGKYNIWSDITLNMTEMSVLETNKEAVLSHFGLKIEQTQLFVALAGGLYSSYENVQEIYKHFRHFNKNVDTLKSIADFVQLYNFPLSNKTLKNIIKILFKNKPLINIPELIKDFRATFASFEMKTSDHGENSKIMEFFKDEYLSFGQDILSYRKVYISSVHLDLIDDKGLLKKLVSPWIRKTVACFLKKEVNPKPIYLMIKNNNKDLISEHEIKVGNCEFPIPSLDKLVFGLMTDSNKMTLLKWITGVTTSNFDVPVKYLSSIIILLHLLKNDAIMFFEASCILQTIVEVNNNAETLKNDEHPDKIDYRAYRASILFQKLYFVLYSSLSCVGLKNVLSDYNFDNIRFQIIYSDKQRIYQKNLKKESEIITSFLSTINGD